MKKVIIASLLLCQTVILCAQHRIADKNVAWCREVYKQIDVTKGHNRVLYSTRHEKGRQGLFAAIFNAVKDQGVPVYGYDINGNDYMDDDTRTTLQQILEDFKIPYTVSHDAITVLPEDIPYNDVTMFYIREIVYYDMVNSCFHTDITAICPVIIQQDVIGDEVTRYPMFWVRYQDVKAALAREMVCDYRNMAQNMSLLDWFTLERYQGTIYKEQDMSQSDSITGADNIADRQKTLEGNMQAVKDHTYNTFTSQQTTGKF